MLFAVGLLGATGDAPEPAVSPAVGRFLVATERIEGSIFQESVVYLVNYGHGGALGLIVNRPTDLSLHDVVQGAVDGSGTLYLGGPVETGTVMMLLRADEQPKRASRVADDVFVSADADVLLEYTRTQDTGRLRVYAGHAGWGPRQLDGEIARGQWLVVDAPSDSIFEQDPEGLWKKLFRRHHRLVARTATRKRPNAARNETMASEAGRAGS